MSVFVEGLEINLRGGNWTKTVMIDGELKDCRDRQPWGGLTDKDACSCRGLCVADKPKEEK